MTVAICHFILSNDNGTPLLEEISSLSVEYFFVLSGFVLAPQIIKIFTNVKFRIKNTLIFLCRRWLRTIPPYALALILAATLFGYGDTINFIKHLLYIQNLTIDKQSTAFYPVGWSLSVEEWFYFLTPLILLVALKKKILASPNDVLKIIMIITLSVAVIRGYIIFTGDKSEWGSEVRRAAIFRLDSICLGFMTYTYFNYGKNILHETTLLFPIYTRYIFSTLLITLFLLVFLVNFQAATFTYLAPLLFTVVVIVMSKVKIQGQKRLSIYLGRISYPIYLTHLLFIPFFSEGILSFISYCVFIIIFSTFSFYGFERLFLRIRPNFLINR